MVTWPVNAQTGPLGLTLPRGEVSCWQIGDPNGNKHAPTHPLSVRSTESPLAVCVGEGAKKKEGWSSPTHHAMTKTFMNDLSEGLGEDICQI